MKTAEEFLKDTLAYQVDWEELSDYPSPLTMGGVAHFMKIYVNYLEELNKKSIKDPELKNN